VESPKPLGLVRESYLKTEVEAWISRHIKLYYITTCLVLPRANAEMLYSVRYDLVVVVMSIIGGGEKFSYGMVRSQKPPLSAPYNNSNTILLLRHMYNPIWIYST
jgi:hypothetical protein